jgi:hypothetical protein
MKTNERRAEEVFANLDSVIRAGLPPIVTSSYGPDGQPKVLADMPARELYAAWKSAYVRQVRGRWMWATGK